MAVRFLFAIAFALIFIGCSKSPYVPVAGNVTLDGKPLAGVDVRFQPTGGTLNNPNVGKGSVGQTDEQGRFQLRVNPETSGAIAGKHRVSIAHAWGKTEWIPPIPRKYNTDSKLTFEVPPEGTEAANFELKSQ